MQIVIFWKTDNISINKYSILVPTEPNTLESERQQNLEKIHISNFMVTNSARD